MMGNDSPADDVLHGADQIAGYTGLTKRQIYYANETRQLPIFRFCGQLTMRKSTYKRCLDQLDEAALREMGEAR
jgi:hypothetical protein